MQAKYIILNNSLNFDIKFSLPYMKIEGEKVYIPFKERTISCKSNHIQYALYNENDEYTDNPFFSSFCSRYHIMQIDWPNIYIINVDKSVYIMSRLHIGSSFADLVRLYNNDISDDQREQILAIKTMLAIS